MPCTFTKQDRLLSSGEFKMVFDNPIKKIHSTHLLAFVARSGVSQPRLGLAITKKKLKLAVERNQIKRLSREHFRLNKADLPVVDMVLIVKSTYDKQTDLNAELVEIFRKIKQIKI